MHHIYTWYLMLVYVYQTYYIYTLSYMYYMYHLLLCTLTQSPLVSRFGIYIYGAFLDFHSSHKWTFGRCGTPQPWRVATTGKSYTQRFRNALNK